MYFEKKKLLYSWECPLGRAAQVRVQSAAFTEAEGKKNLYENMDLIYFPWP